MRVVVTGAAGFVGANLVRRLLSDGHEVSALIRAGTDRWRLGGLDGLELEAVDLVDVEAVVRAIGLRRPQWLFHLAAHGAYSWQRDSQRTLANVAATQAVLEAAAATGCEAVVIAGSSSEYGFKDHPAREAEPLEPNSLYAVSKAAGTMLARLAGRVDGLPTTVLRLYSAYGPWEDPRRLVPTLLAHALREELPPLARPETARDFVWVEDVVDALVLAATHPGEPGEVLNVASGEQTTLRDIVELVREQFGVEAEPRWSSTPSRSWDTATWVGDPSRIAARLDWAPRTSLSDGLRRTAEWLRTTSTAHERYGISA